MAKPVKAVIFDLGNVLVDFNHLLAAEKLAHTTDKAPQEIFELFFDSGLTQGFEKGKISPQDFFLRVKEALSLRMNYDEFLPIWNQIFFLSDKNRSVHNIAVSLEGRYKTAVLSNINTLHFDYLKKTFPIFDTFTYVIASFELGLIKPNPLIYRKALRILKINSPEEAFYTDDRPELVQSAAALGIKSFIFKDAVQLKRDLSESGININ